MNIPAIHTMFENGAVRDAAGTLVAFYDRDGATLYVGKATVSGVTSDEWAMEIVADMDPEPHPEDAPGFVEFPRGEFPY